MKRRLIALLLCSIMTALAPAGRAQGAKGRFGRALGAGEKAQAKADAAYVSPPLTVECWTKLNSKAGFNLLIADEPKSSATHWEIYTYAGSGFFSAYVPGYSPAEIVSNADITDGKWHYVAMQFESGRVRLFVDAREVANRQVTRSPGGESLPGDLTFGTALASGSDLHCDGLIDEARISRGIRDVSKLPKAPFRPDEQTVGLWHFDAIDKEGEMEDASALENPARVQLVQRVSMDDIDNASFHAGPGPFDSEPEQIVLSKGEARRQEGPAALSLDGQWRMAEGGSESQRLTEDWTDAIPAVVPGSVHTALTAAGRIPDPKFGRNDAVAHAQSFKTWWLRRDFARPAGAVHPKLVFDGVAIRGTFWLNGTLLGTHEGMFGGPDFEIENLLQDNNTLVVRLDPAPGDPKAWNNPDWRKTVVFNNVWGWHYSSIPPLGIWRSVRIEGQPAVRLAHPFAATHEAKKGIVDLSVNMEGANANWSGELTGTLQPENFTGPSTHFTKAVESADAAKPLHLRFRVPNPKLWQPNDLGDPNLYRLKLSFVPKNGGIPDAKEIVFGIRTIEMAPLPGGPRSDRFNWTFVINGKPVFIKGAGWCTMDSSMDFSRARYDRFLSLAALQHVQMVRGWGSGMPETDDFYDLCDRKGILVLQEWPTAWDSHLVQPFAMLEETVRSNTLRLRNHPSLAMYGGGNESDNPFGSAIDMMGRTALELDGTRAFHRGEPWGGSAHNYNCYWGREPLDHNLKMTASFFGEFGLACMPVLESVRRYLPEDEQNLWPAPADGSLAHHTPIFNTAEDMSRLLQYAGYFTSCADLPEFIVGSQLSQAVGVRHTLELARTRWPDCSGALYYKMNDNYPAASWSCVDWFGAPKIGHYLFQNSFAPLHACLLFDSVNTQGKPLSLPVYLLDDTDRLKGVAWEVTARAYDGSLEFIKTQTFGGKGAIRRVRKLGEFALTAEQTQTTPLLTVIEVRVGGVLADRTFYFTQYEARKGCLFTLPKTRLSLRVDNDKAVVTNEGSVPAVAVAIQRPGHLDTFTADAGYFWLEPGESRAVGVNATEGLTVEAWNRE